MNEQGDRIEAEPRPDIQFNAVVTVAFREILALIPRLLAKRSRREAIAEIQFRRNVRLAALDGLRSAE